jgi:hypothetical protein
MDKEINKKRKRERERERERERKNCIDGCPPPYFVFKCLLWNISTNPK